MLRSGICYSCVSFGLGRVSACTGAPSRGRGSPDPTLTKIFHMAVRDTGWKTGALLQTAVYVGLPKPLCLKCLIVSIPFDFL